MCWGELVELGYDSTYKLVFKTIVCVHWVVMDMSVLQRF